MIETDIAKCTGCRCCEVACAFSHTGRTGRHLSRIRVIHLYEIGIDAPVVCQQCQERACLACPSHALKVGAQGQIMVSPTLCNDCGACARLCPIGAIETVDGIAFVCDLCGGQPRCVEVCSEGAISFIPATQTVSLALFVPRTKRLDGSEKRARYVKAQGEKLRCEWGVPRG